MAAASNKYVFDENTLSGYYPSAFGYSGGGSVTVTNDGWIYTDWFFQLSSGVWNVTVNGLVRGIGTDPNYPHLGMAISDVSSLTLNVGAEGEISGSQVGLYASSSLPSSTYKISNLGTIYGAAVGISLGTGAAITITNGGLIGAASGGVGISLNGAGKHVITNSGEIDGGIDTSITLSDDTVTNTGVIAHGDVKLGEGTNIFTNKGSALGSLYMGSGTNTFYNSGVFGDSSGNKLVYGSFGSSNTYTNTGTFTGFIQSADSTNTLKNSGSISGSISFGGQTINNITNTGDIGGDIIIGSDSTLQMTNSGAVGGEVSAADDHNNKMSNTGVIAGTLSMGSGNDTVTNSKSLGSDVYMGNGANQFSNSGTVTGAFHGGSDSDTVTNSGTIGGEVDLGGGTNNLSNKGIISGNVLGGQQVDIVTNSGTIDRADFAGGNDHFTNTGHVTNYIYMGAGDDIFTDGNFDVTAVDGSGKDSYSLGAGNDYFRAVGTGSGDSVDNADGGTDTYNAKTGVGGDTYSAQSGSNASYINFDAIAHTTTSQATYSAHQASGTDIGIDMIKGFEKAVGGYGDDYFWGSSASETYEGISGADTMYGGGGNDRLYADDGADFISGGAGADILDPGGQDGDADIFYYEKLSDSTVAKTGRDTIQYFESGHDKIWLHGLGDIHLSNGIGINTGFDGDTGAIRIMQTAQGWSVEFDMNGDHKADMAIDVVDASHSIAWSISNFSDI